MGFEPSETELTGRVFMSLSEPAKALWFRAGHWCAAHGERLVSLAMVKGWGSTKRAADELTRVALWGLDGEDWMVPERRPPEPEPEESVSSKRARAGRLGGLARASKQPSKIQANGEANSDASQANTDFASVAKPGLVPPLASPSPEPEPGLNTESSPDSSAFQLSSEGSDRSPARAPKRRMRRCPDGFELDETGKKLCLELRVSWAVEGPKFRDWEFKDPKSDWQATARTWIRKAAESRPQQVQFRADPRAEAHELNAQHDARKALRTSKALEELMAIK